MAADRPARRPLGPGPVRELPCTASAGFCSTCGGCCPFLEHTPDCTPCSCIPSDRNGPDPSARPLR